MRVLLLLAHAIEEYDQVKLLSELGYDVWSIGAYSDPAHPDVDIRPALPDAPQHPELIDLCREVRERYAGVDPGPVADWAKADLHPGIIDWADVIIVHHFEHTWLVPQWPKLRDKRVIWRTVGQSVEHNERMMAPLHAQGLQIVRYSPKERNIPGYAGEDALIRFYKDPADWDGWTGNDLAVGNVTQNLLERDPWCNPGFWLDATAELRAKPAGPGSDLLPGGIGTLGYDEMRDYLRRIRCYLYTGTQPASYTLGLIEAMMTGVPVVSIGPSWMRVFPSGRDQFEAHEITRSYAESPKDARIMLGLYLDNDAAAAHASAYFRTLALALFGRDIIARQWRDFLGDPGTTEFAHEREAVTA